MDGLSIVCELRVVISAVAMLTNYWTSVGALRCTIGARSEHELDQSNARSVAVPAAGRAAILGFEECVSRRAGTPRDEKNWV